MKEKKYTYKSKSVQDDKLIEELQKQGEFGWRPIHFSQAYPKIDVMIAKDEDWYLTIIFEKEL
jgi:hypothetical protein